MTQAELEAVLQSAFRQCQAEGYPLDERQKQILSQMLVGLKQRLSNAAEGVISNPLDELPPEQRHALLQFIRTHDTPEYSWKIKLLDDWLNDRDSGSVQFIRDQYGPIWLDRVQPVHLSQYLEARDIKLKVGDRIEVSNGLWEWVQTEGPCAQEWVPCLVVSITELDPDTGLPQSYDRTSCTIRFDNGLEYDIQGIYEWNRYNWRWVNG